MTANSITVTATQLVTAAMQEIGALGAGETIPVDQQSDMLQKLQRVIDTFNARRPMVYANIFSTYTLIANHAPHTIGPTGDFVVNQRPNEIPSIGLVLTGSANVEVYLNRRDKDWWATQRVKGILTAIPTDYYYEEDWPNGSIFFWPVPSAVNNVLVQQRTVLAEITALTQSFTLPPGYWDATVYSLAEAICPMFEREPSPTLVRLLAKSLKAVQGNNIKSPRGRTGDAGMPGVGLRGDFNYYSGTANQP